MSSLPNPTEVSGKHNAIYEAYYKQADAKGNGIIPAKDAAKFLKKSGLSDVVLSRIWDLSDPEGNGHLDKAGFFVALKLVALAQSGNEIHLRNILTDTPNPPKVGELPKIIPQNIQPVPTSNTDWSMKTTDKLKYEELFDSLMPFNGLIPGNRVKSVLLESKLPLDTLGKIWDLADEDKDGNLDKHEFTVAMHLVYKALDKRAVPTTLPPELKKPSKMPRAPSCENFVANFPKDIAPPPAISRPQLSNTNASLISLQTAVPSSNLGQNQSEFENDWVVTPQKLTQYEAIFRECDQDKDGLVSGKEVKNVFMKSGVPQTCLAHIWSLCDANLSGKLTLEQFALAMWLVEQKKNGFDVPETLAQNMIPPNLRTLTSGKMENSFMQIEPLKPTYTNTELQMVSNDLDELIRERRKIEAEIAQNEADLRIKSGEIRSLQNEFDTLHATLKQLESQKGEAQKRLDDLSLQVERYREQSQKQEETINEQEGDLNVKKNELQKLKDEENRMDKEYTAATKEVETLSKNLQHKQLCISQVKSMITQLLETERQMNDYLILCKNAMETVDIRLISDYALRFETNFDDAKHMLNYIQNSRISASEYLHHSAEATDNNDNDDFSGNRGLQASYNNSIIDPFNAASNNATRFGFDDNFMNAPFPAGFEDEFGSDSFRTAASSISSDPFCDKKSTVSSNEAGKNDFDADPFAILHAPTTSGQVLSPSAASGQKSGPPPRPESPSPALPPKKSKQPPPRPAPPRPLQGPARPSPPPSTYTSSADTFGQSSGFANFADFDKQAIKLTPKKQEVPSSISRPRFSTTHRKYQRDPLLVSSTMPAFNRHMQILKGESTRKNINNNLFAVSTVVEETSKPPIDFIHDPFKDFRYEETFSISGSPFNDDTEKFDHFKEEFNHDTKQNMEKADPSDSDSNNENTEDFFAKFDDNFNKCDKKVSNFNTVDDDDTKQNKEEEMCEKNNNFGRFEDDFAAKFEIPSEGEIEIPVIEQNLPINTTTTTTTTTTTRHYCGPSASAAYNDDDADPSTSNTSCHGAQSKRIIKDSYPTFFSSPAFLAYMNERMKEKTDNVNNNNNN